MAIYTKSAQLPRSEKDGIRICIMRRPGEEVDWDIWIPHLSPSNEILTAYHSGDMTLLELFEWFDKNILNDKNKYLSVIIELGKLFDITLLCWEIEPSECHRHLVAEKCIQMDKSLKVIIK